MEIKTSDKWKKIQAIREIRGDKNSDKWREKKIREIRVISGDKNQ